MMDRLQIPYEHHEMQEQLHAIAAKHAQSSHPSLVLLDNDPEKYPGQLLSNRIIKTGDDGPLPPDIATALAVDVDARYSPLEQMFQSRYENTDDISRLIEQLRNDNNVINASDHAEIIDIALSHLALTGVIKRAGVEIRTGLVVSKMVDCLGIKLGAVVTPVRELLSYGFDRVFLPIPRSLSTHGLFNESLVKHHNRGVVQDIQQTLRRRPRSNSKHGPLVLGVALPGTVNKVSKADSTKMVVGKVNDGILKYTAIPNTVTIATSVRLSDEPRVFIDDLPMRVESHEDMNRLMARLLTGMALLDGRHYIYDEHGEIKVKR